MRNLHIVIMAGGVGNRLFPVSTPERPKQFLDLLGTGKSLIRLTWDRCRLIANPDHIWVVTGESYMEMVLEHLPEIPRGNVILEPAARNTAPAIALSAWKIASVDPEAVIAVIPSDAYVSDASQFAATVSEAAGFVRESSDAPVVCIGITPTAPSPEYGYIYTGAASGDIVKVVSFKEKPAVDVARAYLSAGGYLWNAGIFVWSVNTICSAIKTFVPGIAEKMDIIATAFGTEDERAVTADVFPSCEKISIDYAVMERYGSIYVARAGWKWSDLGSFESIIQITGIDPRKKL